MNRLRKIPLLSFLSLLFGSLTSSLFSLPQYPTNPEGRIPVDTNVSPNTITLDAGPRVLKGLNVFFTIDFIYWYTKQEGLGYAASGYNPTSYNFKRGRIQNLNWHYSPGLKAGAGLNLREDGWDALIQYTWLYNKTEKSTNTPNLHPSWFILDTFTINTDLIAARANWDFHFNVVDAEFGRNFFVGQFLAIRPNVGFKATWQSSNYHVRYHSVNDTLSLTKIHEEDWGLGSRFGLGTSWFFAPSWSIYADTNLALVWGQFRIRRKDQIASPPSLVLSLVTNQVNNFHTIKPVLELGTGLRFDAWTYNYRYHFRLQAGFEQQIWFSHNQYIRVFEESAHGDLIFQGLTVKGRFDF